MSLRFLHENLVYQAMITASSQNAQFPAENIKDPRRTKVFRGLSSSESIVFDFGDYFEIDTFMTVESGIEALGFSSLTLQLNNTDAWTSPPVSVVVPVDYENGVCFYSFPETQSYRYARIVVSGLLEPVEVSKVFIGKSFYNENICFSYPIEYKQRSNAVVTTNRYFQKFFDEINTVKEFKGTIPSLNKTEAEELMTLLDYVSFTRPIWVIFNSLNILADANRLTGYYFLKEDPTLALDVGNYWTVEMIFEEGK